MVKIPDSMPEHLEYIEGNIKIPKGVKLPPGFEPVLKLMAKWVPMWLALRQQLHDSIMELPSKDGVQIKAGTALFSSIAADALTTCLHHIDDDERQDFLNNFGALIAAKMEEEK